MNENKDYKENLFDLKTIGFTIGITLFIIVTVIGFLKLGLVSRLGLNNTGELGDTIGGIAGPLINLLGAILVYKSFIAQINANKIQLDNIESDRAFNSLWELYKESKIDLDNFEYLYIIDNSKSTVLKGLHSFERLVFELQKHKTLVLQRRKFIIHNISSILQNMSLIYSKIDNSLLSLNDKILIENKMTFLFNTRLESYISDIINTLDDNELELKNELIKSYDDIKKLKNNYAQHAV
jgi:hypothetical protein